MRAESQVDVFEPPAESPPPALEAKKRTIVFQAVALFLYQLPAGYLGTADRPTAPLMYIIALAIGSALWGRGFRVRFRTLELRALVWSVGLVAMFQLAMMLILMPDGMVLAAILGLSFWVVLTGVSVAVGLRLAPEPPPPTERQPAVPDPAATSFDHLLGTGTRYPSPPPDPYATVGERHHVRVDTDTGD